MSNSLSLQKRVNSKRHKKGAFALFFYCKITRVKGIRVPTPLKKSLKSQNRALLFSIFYGKNMEILLTYRCIPVIISNVRKS